MSLYNDLRSIEASEAKRATADVLMRTREHPNHLQTTSLVLERDFDGLLAIIVGYVGNIAERTGASPKEIVEQHREFISGMALALYTVKEIAENQIMPNIDEPSTGLDN